VPEQPKPAPACLCVQHPRYFGQGVREWTQRFGSRDFVAATTPNDLRRSGAGEGGRECRLADASFPAQKDQPTTTA
jgi:hypothetical protein